MKGQFKLFYRILLSLLLVALLPVTAIWMLGRGIMVDQARTAVESQLHGISDQVKSEVDGWSKSVYQSLTLAAAIPTVTSLDAKQQRPVLEAALKAIPNAYLIHTIGANGKNIARSDDESAKDYSSRQYWKDLMSGAVKTTSDMVIGATSKRPAWIAATPIFDVYGKPAATLASAVTMENMSKVIESSRFGKTGFAFLVQDDGKLVASPDVSPGDKLVDFSANPAFAAYKRGESNPIYFASNGVDRIGYAQRTAIGWVCIVQQDVAEGFEPVSKIDLEALIALVVTLALVSLIAHRVANGISKPVRDLTLVADQISRGQLAHDLPEKTRLDEIGALARAIERLAKSMALALQRLRKQ